MIESSKLSSLNVFGGPLDSLGHPSMLNTLKNIENWPSKSQIWEFPSFSWIYDILTHRKVLSGLKIVYKGHFVKSEFTFADPILKK